MIILEQEEDGKEDQGSYLYFTYIPLGNLATIHLFLDLNCNKLLSYYAVIKVKSATQKDNTNTFQEEKKHSDQYR